MTQDAGGTNPQTTPPSFVPAAGRRMKTTTPPPSFTPASARVQGASAQDAPRSIPPVAGRTRRSGGSASDPAPHAAQPPASIPPQRPATRQPAMRMPVSRPAAAPASSMLKTPAASRVAKQVAVARPQHRTRKTVTIFFVTIMILVAALALAVFGAWNWVDGKINHADWLTGSANTPASTWLILGSDERDGSTLNGGADVTGSRTDTILVLTKPKSGPSSLISIPRDSLVTVNDQYMKINAVAQLAGNQALTSTVERITGQNIDHVVQVKFGELQQVVDALGGVKLCYDETVSDVYSGLNWQAGCHNADGATALAFSRMRYSDANGDFGRNERQRQVISAIIAKASSRKTLTNVSTVTALANAGLKSLTVDEKTNPYTLLTMALAFKSATGSNGISGSLYWTDPDYYVDGVGSSVLLDDARNTELFNQLSAGTHAAGSVGTLAEG